ncbi:lytic transglycosylase [Hydrogenophaga crassostreae]|uniref:Lytic transglycosylase n=1 Tax=Hydrogenophaga crassostreae TaxID=1763535 RepID=A0A167HAW5_9BURK|nr:lytic murein transglycosylase [Hydrogenophaga crassostreae]AOW15412.1 lytic transglycosylase [Hydrogenophaga crassostreae]OAD40622.1 lytic transglycosylase [Hydrogenophaga crassostreae]
MKLFSPLLASTFLLAAVPLVHAQASAAENAEFQACLQRLQPMASAKGVQGNTFERLTQGLEPDMSVIEKLDYQPEFRSAIWDYLSGLVDDERVAEGQAMLTRHAETLKRVEQRFGVDPATVVAVWGVESNFGQVFGKYPLVQSLGTLSCFGRRQSYFRGELFSAMRIVQKGDVPVERLVGSWAGAFGHTQFMPSTFERLAVDFDDDGRADLMDNASDALASTANFLKQAGWRTGQPWGMEVKLPNGFNSANEGRRSKRAISEWTARGVRTIDGSLLPVNAGSAGLLTPAGPTGPAFLVFRNFDAIYSYNAAESYGLAIAHLSDRLRGAGPFATPWPTDDPGISRAERRELQGLLILRGHDIGEVDGMLGAKSRAAIQVEQERLGQEATGRGGMKILNSLRGS